MSTASVEPSELNAKLCTCPPDPDPASRPVDWCLRGSQSMIEPSDVPRAKTLPAGLTATAVAWPSAGNAAARRGTRCNASANAFRESDVSAV
jgi:hypothetical protein